MPFLPTPTSTLGTSKSAGTGKSKVNTTGSSNTHLQEISDITKALLSNYFPALKVVPDILYICMAIWYYESTWSLWHSHKDGTTDSRHITRVGEDYPKGYLSYVNDPVIQNLIKGNIDPQTKLNIDEGSWAHGLTGTMGAYFVAGTKHNLSCFGRAEFRPLVTSLQLEVKPGQSIIGLFPYTSNAGILEQLRTKSIASGLLVLDMHYKAHLRINNGDKAKAISGAIGSYLGKGKDANGVTPEMRIAQVSSSSGQLWQERLKTINIVKNGSSVTNSPGSSYAANTVTNDQTRVASTDAQKGSIPGCSTA